MYGVEDKLLAVMSSLMIFLSVIGLRIFSGTFYIPAALFSIVWFVYTILPLIFIIKAPINPASIVYIFAASLAISLSALPFNWEKAQRLNFKKIIKKRALFDSYFLSVILYISILISTILSAATILLGGWSLQDIVFDLLHTSGQYAAQRGNEGVYYGVLGVLSIMFTYLTPVLGGLRSLSSRPVYFFIISMVPAIFTMVIQSSKIVFLVGLCFYISSMIVARVYANELYLPKLKNIIKLLPLILLLSMLVLISFLSRLGDFEHIENIIDPLIYSISSYGFGQIYAFSDFFSYTIGAPSASVYKDDYGSYGAYTFNSVFEILGAGKNFPPGMYEETVWYVDIFETNIFTFFRGLIYDFGIIGSLVFLFIFGLVAHGLFYRIIKGTNVWMTCALYIGILVFIFMGYLFSVFVARYVFLNIVVVWLILWLNDRVASNTKHKIVKKLIE